MSTWLRQFQTFGFTIAKQWSYRPISSNGGPEIQEVGATGDARSPTSPYSLVRSPHESSQGSLSEDRHCFRPRQLCGWAIHVLDIGGSIGRDPVHNGNAEQAAFPASHVQESLRNALEHNTFSDIDPSTLPVAIPYIAKHVERQPGELLLESISLAIMSRNMDLLQILADEAFSLRLDIYQIHPIHLAIDYLDGSKSCCKIIQLLLDEEKNTRIKIPSKYNDRRYSLVDNLMMAILKSHTDLVPSAVDESNKADQFPGEEVSICGRWDADSKCISELHTRSARAPLSWKHKFCHTSTQAICHAMTEIASMGLAHPSDSSGLFVKLCTSCGLKLELSQLHTLVLVAFLLAEAGFEDEDLSGMVACLLCLVSHLPDLTELKTPARRAHVSVPLLLDMDTDDSMDACTHQELSPADFGRVLRLHRRKRWSKKCETGWELFQLLLDRIQRAADALFGSEDEEEFEEAQENYCRKHYSLTPLNVDPTLAVAWAAMQTELLTYRRVNPGDPWLSNNFDMAELLHSLQNEGGLSVGLIREGLMRTPDCSCGGFLNVDGLHPREEHVSTRKFSNFHALTNPERTNYVLDSI